MVIRDLTVKRVLLHLLKDFSSTHTITTLSKELNLSRVGIWKVIKRLDIDKYISIRTVGIGKTSTSLISLNWDNPLVAKTLSLYLTEESITQRRWQVNFNELERVTDFLIIYGSILSSPQQANDIDLLGVTQKKNFLKLQDILDKTQKTQSKKIHPINFTENEFKTELKSSNKAFIDAIKKGIILFGQEDFVKFMKEMENVKYG